ncbi:MAG: SMC-Scp complex subunit ScpB [Planctomycetota bacterium]
MTDEDNVEFPPLEDEGLDSGDGELSLDDLGAAYARAAAKHAPDEFAVVEPEAPSAQADPSLESHEDPAGEEDGSPITPEAIIEAALFVGHPDNQAFTPERLASLMRDVTANEVDQIVDQLNDSYRDHQQAFRIVRDQAGYRLSIAPEIETVRQAFLGKVREARLSQLAVEVLSLVAYQPGISAQRVNDQRGRDCGSVLNQLVRRRLLEMRRIKPEDGGRALPHYFPTERFLVLFGLESLEDLPQVEAGQE